MSIKLLDQIQGQLSGTVFKEVCIAIGEDQLLVKKGLETLLPFMLAGMMRKAFDAAGADALFQLIVSSNYEEKVMRPIAGWNGDQNLSHSIMDLSGPITALLFDDNTEEVVQLISAASGMRHKKSNALLRVTAPIVMGIVGRSVSSSKMDAAGLAGMMRDQRDLVHLNVPAGMNAVLGITD